MSPLEDFAADEEAAGTDSAIRSPGFAGVRASAGARICPDSAGMFTSEVACGGAPWRSPSLQPTPGSSNQRITRRNVCNKAAWRLANRASGRRMRRPGRFLGLLRCGHAYAMSTELSSTKRLPNAWPIVASPGKQVFRAARRLEVVADNNPFANVENWWNPCDWPEGRAGPDFLISSDPPAPSNIHKVVLLTILLADAQMHAFDA